MTNLKTLICATILALPQFIMAQSVGIGTPTPNSSAMLDVSSSTKGILIPRVALTATNAAAPLSSFVAGMMVYNTATAGTAPNNVTPGFYFCNGSSWQKAEGGWSLTGNNGTNSANNFIGTTDNQDVVFKRNNIRAGLLGITNTTWGFDTFNSTSTGINNTAIGSNVLSTNTVSNNNTAIGAAALNMNQSGSSNTAIGTATLSLNDSGFGNVATGYQALNSNESGGYNTAIGTDALLNNIADNNTALGGNALRSNTTGYSNVSIGINSLINNTTRSNLVAIGDSALYNNGMGATQVYEAIQNTAIGSKSLFTNTKGFENTAVGFQSLYSNTDGDNNTALGASSLFKNTTGYYNTAVGVSSLLDNITGTSNTAIGGDALIRNVSGNDNTAIGANALNDNVNGNRNTALGGSSLLFNTSGNSNVAIGAKALYRNTTRSNLVAVGDSALYNNGLGATQSFESTENTAVGSKALFANTIGVKNTALGYNALKSNTSGVNNVAIGAHALEAFQTGFNNIAIGLDAMRNKVNGVNNLAIGTGALANNINGQSNTAFGIDAGAANNGGGNVFLGYTAGANEPGNDKLYINNNNGNSDNALIYGEFNNKKLRVNNSLGIGRIGNGTYALEIKGIGIGTQSGDPQRFINFFDKNNVEEWRLYSQSNRLQFSNQSGNERFTIGKNDGYIGMDMFDPQADLHIKEVNEVYTPASSGSTNSNGGVRIERATTTDSWNMVVDANNDFLFNFNGVTKAYINDVNGAFTSLSDKRAKRNIAPLSNVLSNVLKLEPKTYQYTDNKADAPLSYGFIAQEVEQLFPAFVDTKGPENLKAINYQNFSVVAIEAIKEQQKIIETQEARIAKLEAIIEKLIAK